MCLTHIGVPALRSWFCRVAPQAPQDMAHRDQVDVVPQIRRGTLEHRSRIFLQSGGMVRHCLLDAPRGEHSMRLPSNGRRQHMPSSSASARPSRWWSYGSIATSCVLTRCSRNWQPCRRIAPAGHPPVPPAQLALATILQAYTGVSDDEVSEATTRDHRW